MAASAYQQDDRKAVASWYFLLFCTLLALVIILSKAIHDQPFINSFVTEPALTLVVGIVAGLLAHALIFRDQFAGTTTSEDGEAIQVATSLLSFSNNVFFMGLLPPIMFNSGYQLRRELFYHHIKPIVMLACVGTAINAIATAFSLYAVEKMGWMGDFSPTLLELLTFGSLISATDSVSVLGVFQAKKVDPHLFYLVFGESSLNDAVSLVLFNSFADLLVDRYNGLNLIRPRVVDFVFSLLLDAICSPVLGITFAFASALLFKHMDFRQSPMLELPLYIVLNMYFPFIMAENLQMSGIVTIFFSGISARRYIAPNVSDETARNADVIFKLAASLAETAIFLELGLSVFGLSKGVKWKFVFWALAATLLGRALGIYPLTLYYNRSLKVRPKPDEPMQDNFDLDSDDSSDAISVLSRNFPFSAVTPPDANDRARTPRTRKDKRISMKMAHVLWFAGLRGAVAYACAREFPDVYGHDDEFIATTMIVVLVTIIFFGGTTESMLQVLDIKMGVDEEEYMQQWHKKQTLRGAFHRFEYKYIYCVVVRDPTSKQPPPPTSAHGIELDKAFNYLCQDNEFAHCVTEGLTSTGTFT